MADSNSLETTATTELGSDPKPVRHGRQWTRISVASEDEETTLELADGSKIQGLVVNSSFGGIGVTVVSTEGLNVGDELSAMYHGAPMLAVVRCLRPDSAGSVFVGLEWVPRKR